MENYLYWLFGLDRWKKILFQMTFDIIIASISILLAFFVRLESANYLFHIDTYIGISVVAFTTVMFFSLQGLYNNLTRYISNETTYSIAIGSCLSCLTLMSIIFLLGLEIPRSVPLIYMMFLCILATAMRLFIHTLGQMVTKENAKIVAIYSAGDHGIQLMDSLRKNSHYIVKLFVDDNITLDGKNIGGVPITNLENAKKKFKKFKIEILLIPNLGDIDKTRRQIFDMLLDYPLIVKTIPTISRLISGQFEIAEMKDIKIEDLLGRKPVKCDSKLMAKTINQQTILVTGAGGSIGSELCRQIIYWKPQKIIILDLSEFTLYTLLEELKQHPFSKRIDIVPLIGSIQDRQFIEKVFHHFQIDTVYHAAAYKHVPLMEQNVMQCIANNIFGTLNIVELAITTKVKNFILVSTDKAVNPTNFMGASKRFAEIICQTLSTQKKETCFSIVRFGNVLGSSGSVVPLFKKQIKKGGPLTLTHPEITRYFMTISEAAQLLIQAGSISKGGDVFVLDMGEPIKILDLAKRMIVQSGLRPVMDSRKILKDDEIAIIISGLRPGEKLYEELSYNVNLTQTIHPRIYTSAEIPMKNKELQALLSEAWEALSISDHKRLYKVIASVTKDISSPSTSVDLFIHQHKSDKIEESPFGNNK